MKLQRVMSGEIFTAVPGGAPPARFAPSDAAQARDDSEPPAAGDAPADAEGDESSSSGETAGPLAHFAERLRNDADSAKERFKPYRPAQSRHAETDEAKRTVNRHVQAAARALKEKRPEDGVQHLLRAIAREDGDSRIWVLLGGTYLRTERPFKAAVAYLRALGLDEGNEQSWLGLSRCFRAVNDPAGGLEVLDRLVQIRPDSADAWSERGLALESLERLTDATRSFSKALELKPDHRVARGRSEALAAKVGMPLAEPVAPLSADRVVSKGSTQGVSAPEEELPDFTDLASSTATAPPSPEAPSRPTRVRTYVDGLDERLGEGIPWGHVVLVQGPPGTMKSSLAFSILVNNATGDGLHGLYVSLHERTSSLLKQMGSLGLKLSVDRGSLVILDPRAVAGLLADAKDWIVGLEHALAAIREERGVDLLVIDSLEALEVLGHFKDQRREVFRLFDWLRDLDLTTFLITERPEGTPGGSAVPGAWDADFLADGIVQLRPQLVSDSRIQLLLRVAKMRGVRHDPDYLTLAFDEKFKVARMSG